MPFTPCDRCIFAAIADTLDRCPPHVGGCDRVGFVRHVPSSASLLTMVTAPSGDLGPTFAGYTPCRHRTARWCCAGYTLACTLGLGDKGGIVDPQDCKSCSRLTPPETTP